MTDPQTEKIRSAFATARRIRDASGGNPDLLDGLARMLATIGDACILQFDRLVRENKRPLAHELVEGFLDLNPGHTALREKLVASYQAVKRNDWAITHLKALTEIEPDNGHAFARLGMALIQERRVPEAIAANERAHELRPDDAGIANNLANLLLNRGEIERAQALITRAVATLPDNPVLLRSMALIAQEAGQLELARDSFLRLSQITPDNAETHRLLGLLTTYTHDHPHIRELEALGSRMAPDDPQSVPLGFALFRAYDAIGDDRAFDRLDQANLRKRSTLDYDVRADVERMRDFERIYSQERLERHRNAGDPSRAPIFIVGLPRSGTTLTEQILASHRDIHGAGELDLVHPLHSLLDQQFLIADGDFATEPTAEAFKILGRRYLDAIAPAMKDKPRNTDKMPVNFMLVGFIRLMLPNAKIIHCRRAPLSSCFSLYSSFLPSQAQRYSWDLNDIADYYLAYRELMDHWHDVAADAIFDFSYEALIANQEEQTRKLLDFLELDFDPACLDFHNTDRTVRTLSAGQVRKGLYKGADDRAWRYADGLQPLIERLEAAGIDIKPGSSF
ncbi:tetratricopeptide repeat-containing sulfotransferase family protein [Rhizobium alvei]|uniref:Sulfotransferase n=1 Tax=Rhizobium alvei TaxID=1132659 RepID=A0ABT8YL23_9HYPH|nr:tetratricopeptide repeat-containing sulfotransferase family protein [Rhizobium alvei]MDO6964316.1 sulfotransferase [Rhizobium alvei]